jgi:hypothetical protein
VDFHAHRQRGFDIRFGHGHCAHSVGFEGSQL